MMDAADRLKKYRIDHGMSQRELASVVSRMAKAAASDRDTANQRSVSNWELRLRRPDRDNADAIERLAGIRSSSWKRVALARVSEAA